jgi:hypothetical protein
MGCGLQSGAAQSEFQSVSSTVQSAGGDRFSVKSALSLFLSGLIVPHRSRQIPETVALYYTPNKTKNTRQGQYTPCDREVKTECIPVFDKLSRPWFN